MSNLGNIRGVRGYNLAFFHNNSGYPMICLFRNRQQKAFYVHRLVAIHFVDNIDGKKEVNHIDGDKDNNVFSNLEWVTRSENQEHAFNILHPGCHKVPRNRKPSSKV